MLKTVEDVKKEKLELFQIAEKVFAVTEKLVREGIECNALDLPRFHPLILIEGHGGVASRISEKFGVEFKMEADGKRVDYEGVLDGVRIHIYNILIPSDE